MPLCPLDLEYCNRPECNGRHCAESGDAVLVPCVECGYLIVVRARGVCPECVAAELAKES